MRLIRFIALLTILCLTHWQTKAQSGISLYHLNNATFQGNHFNAAFMPEGKFFLGIPVLSGISLDLNSPVSYNQLTTTNELGELEYDFSNVASLAKPVNFFSFEADINLLHLVFRPKSTSAFSIFIRERIAGRGFYTDKTAGFWNGNTQFRGQGLDLSDNLADARHYREYGIGLWKSIPNKGINLGVRFKFLNGMYSIISDRNFEGKLTIGQDYEHSVDFNSGRVNMSGINMLISDDTQSSDLTSHLISNGNIGFGIDLGAHWKINDQLSAAFSVNDLGYINWKEDPENIWLQDTSVYFAGVDLVNTDDFGSAIDSLMDSFIDTTTHSSFRSGLNTSSYGSLLFQLTPNDLITGTIGANIVQDQWRMLYAIGYTRKVGDVLKVSGNLIRTPQQGLDVGIGMAATFGAFQVYMASDKLIKIWNVPETKAFDFRFGINFVFGRTKEVKDDRSDLQHPSPYGKKERVEKSDGIYWIIKRQKPRPIYEPPKGVRGG